MSRSAFSVPERHALVTVPSNERDKLEKRRTTAILRNDWRGYAMALASRGRRMATTQDEMIAELQRANVELRKERDAALAQKAALAEVLDVINRSPGDPGRCSMRSWRRRIRSVAPPSVPCISTTANLFARPQPVVSRLNTTRWWRSPFSPNTNLQMMIRGDRLVHVPDVGAIGIRDEGPISRAFVEQTGVRSFLAVPLRKDGAFLGCITANRLEVRPFTDNEIAQLESFAAQAVIAIENARLVGELRERTSDLQESLEYQTATSDVLKVISRSTFDLQPVLDTVIQAAARLCDADQVIMNRLEGEGWLTVANFGFPPEFEAHFKKPGNDLPSERGECRGEGVARGSPVHIHDVTTVPNYPKVPSLWAGNERHWVYRCCAKER